MISLRTKKGYGLNMAGGPSHEVKTLEKPLRVAVLPEKIPYIKPRLKIEKGQHVNIGTVLCEDKQHPDLKLLSPGGGRIVNINFGPRRVIREVVIQLDPLEEYEPFQPVPPSGIADMNRKQLVKRIMSGGLWPFFRALPFRNIADSRSIPPSIIIRLSSKEPFQPDPAVYLKGKRAVFEFGIDILKILAPEKVFIFSSSAHASVLNTFKGIVSHSFDGNYPADDPGVFLYHIRESSSDNRAWYIDGQDLLLIAQMLSTGRYPTERTIVIAGPGASERMHLTTRMGAPLTHIVGHRALDPADCRYILGGIFKGYAADMDGYLGFYETAVTLMPPGDKPALFGFARPGFNKPSLSRSFLSVFNTSDLEMDCGIHGEVRACVNCGYCTQVCPVDILPQFTYKSILADEIEEALSHGLLDCAECGLCTYVCPSKIELGLSFKNAKESYYREIS